VPSTQSPTINPTGAPTAAPTTNTNAPTSAGGVPFRLTYTLDPPNTPSQNDLNSVQSITERFLEEIFNLSFDFDPNTEMESFTLELIENVDENGVVTIDYEANVEFSEDSAVTPTDEQVQNIISMAFEGINLDVYVDLIQETPPNNAFSNTVAVTYQPIMAANDASPRIAMTSLSGKELLGVIGAGVIVLLGTVAMIYEQKNRKQRMSRQRNYKVSLTI